MGHFISGEMDASYEKRIDEEGVWMVENMSQIIGST